MNWISFSYRLVGLSVDFSLSLTLTLFLSFREEIGFYLTSRSCWSWVWIVGNCFSNRSWYFVYWSITFRFSTTSRHCAFGVRICSGRSCNGGSASTILDFAVAECSSDATVKWCHYMSERTLIEKASLQHNVSTRNGRLFILKTEALKAIVLGDRICNSNRNGSVVLSLPDINYFITIEI